MCHLSEHGVTELWASVESDNERSQRLLARVGFARTDEPEHPLGAFLPGDDTFIWRG